MDLDILSNKLNKISKKSKDLDENLNNITNIIKIKKNELNKRYIDPVFSKSHYLQSKEDVIELYKLFLFYGMLEYYLKINNINII